MPPERCIDPSGVMREAMQVPPPGYVYRTYGEELESWLRDNDAEYSITPAAEVRLFVSGYMLVARHPDWLILEDGEFRPVADTVVCEIYDLSDRKSDD